MVYSQDLQRRLANRTLSWRPPNNIEEMYDHPEQRAIRESTAQLKDRVLRSLQCQGPVSFQTIAYLLQVEENDCLDAVFQLIDHRQVSWDGGARYFAVLGIPWVEQLRAIARERERALRYARRRADRLLYLLIAVSACGVLQLIVVLITLFR